MQSTMGRSAFLFVLLIFLKTNYTVKGDVIVQLKKLYVQPVPNYVYGRFVRDFCGRSTMMADLCKVCVCRSDGLGWFCAHTGMCAEDKTRQVRDTDEHGEYIFRSEDMDEFFDEFAAGRLTKKDLKGWSSGAIPLLRRRKREASKQAENNITDNFDNDEHRRFIRAGTTTAAPALSGNTTGYGNTTSGKYSSSSGCCSGNVPGSMPSAGLPVTYLPAVPIPKAIFYPAGNLMKFMNMLIVMFLGQYGAAFEQVLEYTLDPVASPMPTVPGGAGSCPPCESGSPAEPGKPGDKPPGDAPPGDKPPTTTKKSPKP